MDMKYHWLWDRISQKQCQHYWAPGNKNKGNYVTKHHAPVHHEAMRLRFLTSIATGPVTSPDQKPPYQGCLSCMSGSQTPVEDYIGIKQAYLGSFGE